jgi:hypothetical protein
VPTQLDTPLYTLSPGTAVEWSGNSLDDTGVAWIVTSEDGWSSSAPARPSQADKTIGDGTWAGQGFYAGRLVNLQGTAVAPDRISMLWAKEALLASFGPWDLTTLEVAEAHLTRTARVRLSDKIEIQDKGGWAFTFAFGVLAPDPRRYGAASEITVSLPAGSTTGRAYPRTYPMLYGGGGGGGVAQWVNAGTYAKGAPAVITIFGPVITPRVNHDQSGSHLQFGLTVPYGQFLVVDLAAQSAMLGGTANRTGTLSTDSAWFLLPPGQNELRFNGQAGANPDGSTGSPWMTVQAAPAWALAVQDRPRRFGLPVNVLRYLKCLARDAIQAVVTWWPPQWDRERGLSPLLR